MASFADPLRAGQDREGTLVALLLLWPSTMTKAAYRQVYWEFTVLRVSP